MKKSIPKVSIIIANYNGRQFLTNCISAIGKLTFPLSDLEVIFVDNASADGSTTLVKKQFPWVKIICLEQNQGFTGANIAGLKAAVGEYIVLLNNDTEVTPEWLSELLSAAAPDNIGIVSSKILLSTQYLPIQITSSTVYQSELDGSANFSPRGVLMEDVYHTAKGSHPVWYDYGFLLEKQNHTITLRWTLGVAQILLPVPALENSFTFVLHGYPKQIDTPQHVQVSSGSHILLETTIAPFDVQKHTVVISKEQFQDQMIDLVQNAGNIVLRNGLSKDRGSVVRVRETKANLEFYDKDSYLYDQPRELAAACGAGMLIKRAVIDQVGFLDGHYFMYYEDIDFSLRAWKMGWDIVFAPKARMYHAHRATSGREETEFMLNMTERNHLFLLITHFPVMTCIIEYILFVIKLLLSLMMEFLTRFFYWPLYRKWRIRAAGRLEACKGFHQTVFSIIRNRIWWAPRLKRSYADLQKLLY